MNNHSTKVLQYDENKKLTQNEMLHGIAVNAYPKSKLRPKRAIKFS